MSLAISVRDYRGCERADVSVSRLAIVAGLNGAGKSSFMQAAGAALAQQPLPAEVKKKDAKKLVRGGTDKAKVTAMVGKSVHTVTLPAAELVTDGPPLAVSPYAAGLVSVVHLSEKERRAELSKYLKAAPDKKDLANALLDIKAPEELVTKLWDMLRVDGWDVVHQTYREAGAKKKGAWEHVTGENYGARKSADWVPQGWEEDLTQTTEEALIAARDEAVTEHEAAIRADAHSEEQLRLLRGKAAQVGELEIAVDKGAKELKELNAAMLKAEEAYKALPAPPTETNHPACPHCGADVAVTALGGGKHKLVKPELLDPAEIEKMAKALAKAQKETERAVSAHADAQRVHDKLEQELEDAQAAEKKLATIAQDPPVDTTNADDLRAAVERADRRFKMFNARQEASKLNSEIIRIGEITAILGPDGLRKRKLIRAAKGVNDGLLTDLYDTTGWGVVRLNEDLEPEYEGRPYALVSRSERYRVRVAMQLLMASLDGSQAILIDDADALDPPGRNGLFEYLQTLEVPVIVAMMAGSADRVPNLAAAGIGVTYWVEDGIARELEVVTAAAAE